MEGLKEFCQVMNSKVFLTSSPCLLQELTLSESVPVLLAVYEVVTQSHSYRQQSKHIDVSVSILFPITYPYTIHHIQHRMR